MFAAVKDFLSRHRRKFVYTGLVVGGVALLSKLAERKLVAWQTENAHKLLEQQKRKQHYERTLDTTRIALLNLLPNVRKVIERELDSDIFIQAIKDQPEKKRQLWEQLKLVGFGRTVCTVVCSAIVAPVLHVMMIVLAANTLETTSDVQSSVTFDVQTRYLSCLQDLIEEQLPVLISKALLIINNALSLLPLSRKLTLSQLESLLQQVTHSITSNKRFTPASESDNKSESPVLPWSQYLKEPEPIITRSECNETLRRMYLHTVDILNTDDFNEVVNTVVQVGLNFVLDEMAAFYFSTSFAASKPTIYCEVDKDKHERSSNEFAGTYNSEIAVHKQSSVMSKGLEEQVDALDASITSKGEVTRDLTEEKTNTSATTSHCSDGNDGGDSSIASTKPTIPTTNDDSNLADGSSKSSGCEIVSCVVVKLVPMLSSVVHKALPTARQTQATALFPCAAAADEHDPASYYRRLIVCCQLEALAYNVYDALVVSNATACE